ncbi:CPCC family cysteine-rich protein [Actinomadura flavalba]|uniref:CPCC family cysteine-rich protein n=1 Tax=Actinomadura flavalba TaxID=1120938 RepID=UPI001969D156
MPTKMFPCPCCGYLAHDSPPGSYAVCPICAWEDDLAQLRWPDHPSGPNGVSLVAAQACFESTGACTMSSHNKTRPPAPSISMDLGFRAIDPSVDGFEQPGTSDADWPTDRTRLYWWRPTFWRRAGRP